MTQILYDRQIDMLKSAVKLFPTAYALVCMYFIYLFMKTMPNNLIGTHKFISLIVERRGLGERRLVGE